MLPLSKPPYAFILNVMTDQWSHVYNGGTNVYDMQRRLPAPKQRQRHKKATVAAIGCNIGLEQCHLGRALLIMQRRKMHPTQASQTCSHGPPSSTHHPRSHGEVSI